MGKVKAMLMDMEDNFLDEAQVAILGCDHEGEFAENLNHARYLMAHLSDNEYVCYVSELWNSYWSNQV
tara:strand:+ start:135 stop:338 length:204 start_codon:yes stop_codon:yes gene_type:complete